MLSKKLFLFLFFVASGIFTAALASAQTCPHTYQGINCGDNWYCGGCRTTCPTCPDDIPGSPAGATVLNYANCTCSCPSGQIVCAGACVTPPTCPTTTREQANTCSGCGACKAGYSPDPANPDPPNPCLKTAYMDYWNIGDFKITGGSPGGDLYLASGKAIRVDNTGAATLNLGNWGGGERLNVNLYGGGGGLNLQNGFLTGAYVAQSPWATNTLGSKNALGLQVNRLLGATTGRYTVTTSGFSSGSASVLFDGFYDASMIIPYDGTGTVEIDFNPQLVWTPNTQSGFTYMDGIMVINFYHTFLPTNVKVEMYRYAGGADGWQTIYETKTNNKNPLIIPTNPIFNFVKKLKFTFSGGGHPTYGIRIAEIEWFPTRESSANQLANIPKYYSQNIDISMPEIRMRSSSNWNNITAKITNSGDVMGTRLCIGADCRTSWPEAVNAFVQNGNSFGTLAVLGTNDNFPLVFETNNIERMRIDTAGNVGIGTDSPSYKLVVSGASPREYIWATSGNPELDLGDGTNHWAIYRDTSSDQLRFWRTDNRMVITSDGKVGIGTISPNKLLHIYKDSGDNAELDIQSVAGADKHWGIYQDRATEQLRFWQSDDRMVITSNGKVGIGTTNPSYTLDVNSTESRAINAQTSYSTGYGVYGAATADGAFTNYGGYFSAAGAGAGTSGVYGEATANADYVAGVYGKASGNGAVNNVGGYFESLGTGSETRGVIGNSINGAGVRGEATGTGAVANYGGYFTARGDEGYAVRGEALGKATNYGGYFQAAGDTGYGVYGYATNNTSTNYGVYGKTSSSSGWGGYFTGGQGAYADKLVAGIPMDPGSRKLFVAGYVDSASSGENALFYTEYPSGVTLSKFFGLTSFAKITDPKGPSEIFAGIESTAEHAGAGEAKEVVGFRGGAVTKSGGSTIQRAFGAEGLGHVEQGSIIDAFGVRGLAGFLEEASSGNVTNAYGVYGQAGLSTLNSTGTVSNAYGVYGKTVRSSGTLKTGYGGYFASNVAVTNYGIYATASGGTTNWAGYFGGDVYTTGNLTVGGGSYRVYRCNNGTAKEGQLIVDYGGNEPQAFCGAGNYSDTGLRVK